MPAWCIALFQTKSLHEARLAGTSSLRMINLFRTLRSCQIVTPVPKENSDRRAPSPRTHGAEIQVWGLVSLTSSPTLLKTLSVCARHCRMYYWHENEGENNDTRTHTCCDWKQNGWLHVLWGSFEMCISLRHLVFEGKLFLYETVQYRSITLPTSLNATHSDWGCGVWIRWCSLMKRYFWLHRLKCVCGLD